MELTKEEEGILEGERGKGLKKAMEILVALGDINDAEKLIPISSAQVSGVSYKTIGDAGLEFLSDWASEGMMVKVSTTLNPMGLDLELWREMGFSKDFVEKQEEIIRAYKAMGITPSCTCTPYLAGNKPRFGEDIAWAESSAVVFANSVLGARTNRESGVSALAGALIGKIPCYGLHLEKKRRPTFHVRVKAKLRDQADYAALGYYVGKNFDGIPLFDGLKPSVEDMKALGAALAVGPISMFHIKGVTPGDADFKGERIEVGEEELEEVYEELNTSEEADVICIGCPHCSIREIREIIKAKPKREVWVFTARQNKALLEGYSKNIKVISDTCMVVSPLEDLGISSIGVNSAKAAFYSINLSGLGVRFDTMEKLVKRAL
jgi:hypothetical protein